MASITVKDSDTPTTASVEFLDAEGAVTEPDLLPTWQSNDPTVVSISSVSVDGLTAELQYGQPGSVTITATSATADGTPLVATGSIVVQPGEAVQSEITFATPEAAPVVAASDPTSPSTSDGPLADAGAVAANPSTPDASTSSAPGTTTPAALTDDSTSSASTADPATTWDSSDSSTPGSPIPSSTSGDTSTASDPNSTAGVGAPIPAGATS